jgi:hypothetical protein
MTGPYKGLNPCTSVESPPAVIFTDQSFGVNGMGIGSGFIHVYHVGRGHNIKKYNVI